MQGNINLIVSGTPEEIAALALELQERLNKKDTVLSLKAAERALEETAQRGEQPIGAKEMKTSVVFTVDGKEIRRAVYVIRPSSLARFLNMLPALSDVPLGNQAVLLSVEIKSQVLNEIQKMEVDPAAVPLAIKLLDTIGLRQE